MLYHPNQYTDEQIPTIAVKMRCPVTQFPITYLGPPLSIRKASTASLLPLVKKLKRKLSTWRVSMLSKGDRLALVRHVLCAILTHLLIAIAFNQSILKKVNRIIHGFLWAESKEAIGGQCLVN
ncbi:MATE efflux family protein DTX1 [Hordeum vulgare]|nr:MATE efflux family protein DTX1 [Hordeum vulgare]